MSNKPMLSVEREVIEKALRDALTIRFDTDSHVTKLRSLLDKTEDKICSVCNGFGRYQDGDSVTDEDGRCPNIVDCDCGDSERIPEYRTKPAARNQGETVAYTTAGMLEIAKRLPLTGRIGAKATKDERWNIPLFLGQAEQPAPVADHPQCEECKGWGYHENHHEGGGTECGECGGSGNATVAVALDTSALLGLLVSEISVDDRGFYHLSGIHPNNFKRALEASGAKLTSEVKSHKSPIAVVMHELSGEEVEFIKAVQASRGGKIVNIWKAGGEAIWPRLEEIGLIKCLGGYKWELTFDAVDMGIKARLNGVKP